jgi:UDP-GlcNAc:undecaprenyl-phosphate/decaprenyl-phosphate GlcNAc-1-phosphate transferase
LCRARRPTRAADRIPGIDEVVPQLVLPIREYLLAGLTAAVITFLLVGPVRVLALRLGAVAWPRGRDVHVTPTPRWGGLAMLGGVLGGVGMAYQLPALRLAFDTNSAEVVGVMIAAVLLAAVGALDDRYDLDALTKFAGQATAAGVLIIFGVQVTVFWVPWGGGGTGISGSFLSLGQEQGVLLTVLLTVALVNAMNFIDGLDGLAAGIGMITALASALFAIGLVDRVGNDPSAYSPALIAVVLAGACLGFLPHNFNPARVFMGDSGSMLLGLMLSAASVSLLGRLDPNNTATAGFFPALLPLLLPLAVLAVPFIDLLLAVVRRTRSGQAPWEPDKLHLHHRLLRLGHSHARAVLIMYLWSALIAGAAVTVAFAHSRPYLVIAAYLGAGAVLLVASNIPRLRQQPRV